MKWQKIYEERKCTAEEAIKSIKSGDRVILGQCVSEPQYLVNKLVENASNYRNVTLTHMFSFGAGKYSTKEYSEHFHFEGFFCSAGTRKSVFEGQGDYIPAFFYEIPLYMRKGLINVDVCMVMLSPPDSEGYCNIGVDSSYTFQALKSAKTVIAQINKNVPYAYGDTRIHVSDIDYFVEHDCSLPEWASEAANDVEVQIGKYCASLIEDGATLQLGIGSIPDAVLASLGDKKHLGIHSEMIADRVVDLIETGIIDCSKKTLEPGRVVVTCLMGTKRLYDFCNNNPMIVIKPVDYVNNPAIIAQNNNMVSINSAIQADFMGQVVADSIGIRQFSGVGGQVDFVRGTAMAFDDKGISIIAMPSVAEKKDGTKISRIVPYIDKGAAVTTSRNDVDYIVTEYGIAHLKAKNLKDRARALINIAHPEFREELKKEYKVRFNVEF